MRIKCSVCKRHMTFTGVLSYAGVYLCQYVGEALTKVLQKALETYLNLQTKSTGDGVVAEIANACELKCPKCKKFTCWDPAPEREHKIVIEKQGAV